MLTNEEKARKCAERCEREVFSIAYREPHIREAEILEATAIIARALKEHTRELREA